MMCDGVGGAAEKLQRELRDMLLEDSVAVFHALYCVGCGTRDVALAALALGGWEESDFMQAVRVRHEV